MPYNCAVYKCGHNSKRDKDLYSFYRFPAVMTHQGEETMRLSSERRQAWIDNINRDNNNLTSEKMEHTRVCSAHFISGIQIIIYCLQFVADFSCNCCKVEIKYIR